MRRAERIHGPMTIFLMRSQGADADDRMVNVFGEGTNGRPFAAAPGCFVAANLEDHLVIGRIALPSSPTT
jgi:hypothetical protein